MTDRIFTLGLRKLARAGSVTAVFVLAVGASAAGSEPAPAADPAGDQKTPDSPPVLLRDSLLLTPVEAAGTGVAPEVGVRVQVDRKGRVENVEVRSITPSTEYDDLFRRTVVETLRDWRYAPARRGGEPVEATLEWTIQFREKAGWATAESSSFAPAILDDASRAARIFSLPPEKQKEILERHASLAEQNLAPPNRRKAESPRFVVISDAPDAETAEVVAGNLEAVFGLLDETIGADLELQPTQFKLVAYLFWSRASFASLAAQAQTPEWVNGVYLAPGVFAFHLETGDVDRLLSLMIHEAVHAYVDRHVTRPGFHWPPWLSEGFAEYFAHSEIQDGRLVPGAVRKGEYVLDRLRGGATRRRTDTGLTFDRVQRAVRKGEGVAPAELLAMDRDAFYDEDRSLHYALSWLLVHFLRHGEPGWSEEEFPSLVLYLAEGYPAAAAVEAVYGIGPEELGGPFREHVGDL